MRFHEIHNCPMKFFFMVFRIFNTPNHEHKTPLHMAMEAKLLLHVSHLIDLKNDSGMLVSAKSLLLMSVIIALHKMLAQMAAIL